MADRTVKVTLTAQVAGYIAGMEQARSKTETVSKEAQQKLQKQGEAFTAMGAIAMRAGAIAAAGIALAVARFAEFDEAISQVQAATQESTANMNLLRDAALEAGASTVFTATEAAHAIEELGKAGLTTAEILEGGLDGALTLAAAGGLEVADAAAIAAISLKQFGLEGSDIPHVADLLAAGAGKAVGSVDDLSAALNQAGLIANAAGFSIEDTTGVLAAFADAGLLGSDAGTSLKTAIISLQAPSEKAKKAMADYGLEFYNSSGQMKSFEEIAGQLESKLGGLTDEQRNSTLATIFGTDAIRSANVLYTQGAAGIKKYVDQTNESGYAARVAADRLNNLSGDVEKLGGAFDTALIKQGSVANDSLRTLTQSATFLVDAAAGMPEPLQAVGLTLTAVAAATLLSGGAALTVIPKWVAFKATIEATGGGLKGFAANSLKAGGAIGIATLALSILIQTAADSAARVDELGGSLDATTGSITDYTREVVKKQLADTKAYDQATNLGISLSLVTDAALGNADAMKEVEKQATAAAEGNFVLSAQSRDLQFVLNRVSGELDQSKTKQEQLNDASRENAKLTKDSAGQYKAAADQAQAFTDELTSLIGAINEANGLNQDAAGANAAYQKTLADAGAEVKAFVATNGASVNALNENTVAGSANLAMLADLAGSAQAAAQAQVDAGGSAEDYQASLVAANKTIYDTTFALTGNAAKAQEVADKYARIPTLRESKITVDASNAVRNLDSVLDKLGRVRSIAVKVNSIIGKVGNSIDVDGMKAGGGAIYGPGGPKDDKAGLYGLSNGEHVLTAEDVTALGGQSGVYAMRASLQSGGGYSTPSAPVYAPAGGGGGTSVVITVPVTVHSLAIDNPDAAGRMIAGAVQTSLRNGVIPTDWNKP